MQSGATGERAQERAQEREVGKRRVRREDLPLITGRGEYTDDFVDAEILHLAVHRSQYGHARIEEIDTAEAESRDGVVAVFTADDIADSDTTNGYEVDGSSYPSQQGTTQPLLAEDRVRYAGEPLAVVVAEDRYVAATAADAVGVDYERLDAVTDIDSALAEEAPVLHEGHDSNRVMDWEFGDHEATAEAFDAADNVVSLSPSNQRLIPNAMEPRGAYADFEDGGKLTVRMSTQVPHRARAGLAEVLPLTEEDLRVIAPDVGGGFGSKGGASYPEEPLTAWAALQLERPVKWIATRTEALRTDHHGRDVHADIELAVDDDGTMRGLRVDARLDLGAYLVWGSTPAGNFRTLISGQYDIPAIAGRAVGAYTNKAPVAPYRGAGRPESIFTLERVVKRAATQLGIDPVELRRRNQIPADDFPHETAHGVVYDSGNYERALDKALEVAGYEEWRRRQREARQEGRYLGIGVCSFVENTGSSPGRPEMSRVTVNEDGSVVSHCGTSDHGQGHETTFSQVLADELGVAYGEIEIVEGDTDDLPEGVGTFGSRSAPVGASAVVEAAEKVRERARELAAEQLEAAPEDVEFDDGGFHPVGAPDRSVSIAEVAALAHGDGPGEPGDLQATASFDPPTLCYAFGTHIAIVEVDPDSGEIDFENYVAVDDIGTQFNPTIVEGQVHGGVAQGIGQALYEGAVYDDTGTLATGSFQDYAMPKAMHIPEMVVEETETPAPNNPTGAKGAGEGGSIASPPAVVNAVVDAMAPFDVADIDTPMTAERVWRAANR